jgi:alkylhydroperoxidase family enzyme
MENMRRFSRREPEVVSDLQPGPRIGPLPAEEIGDDAMEIIAGVMQAQALPGRRDVPEFIATMIRHRELFRRQADLSAQLFAGALPFRLTELVLLRTAWLCKGGYVWGHHSQLAQRVCGFSQDDIARIIAGSSAPGWDELDGAVVRAVEELHESAQIRDATWAVLARHLDERQLIELPILVGQMHGVIYTQNALRVRLMPGSLGLDAR